MFRNSYIGIDPKQRGGEVRGYDLRFARLMRSIYDSSFARVNKRIKPKHGQKKQKEKREKEHKKTGNRGKRKRAQ